ncbi:MAG: hypothetical protein Q7U57_13425 [Methylovulum sp.]|nr:hypothetical protein [Methylovulum sp.]
MPQQPPTSEKTELTSLHAATCLSMTQFINGHHCPKLAHLIVHQLRLLVGHPELEHSPASREMYQKLLTHWQEVTAYLLEQQAARQPLPNYH